MIQPKKIKGILFDFDGVLVKSMEDHFIAWKAAMNDFGVSLKGEEYYPFEGMNIHEIAKKFCREKGLDESLNEKIVEKKESYYLQHGKIEFYPGVKETIKFLKSKGIKIGIVTSSRYFRMQKMLPPSFLNNFDVIVGGEHTQKGKPHPDPYLKGLEMLGLRPEECVVVENAPLGIKAAKKACISCVAITSTIEKSKLKEADIIVEKFSDLKELMII